MNRRQLLKEIKALCPWGYTPLDTPMCGLAVCKHECEKILEKKV
jgi:hypothetical protein